MAKLPPFLEDCQTVILLGQSNIAGGYIPITDWPPRLQFPQACVPRARIVTAQTWAPMQQFVNAGGDLGGVPVGSWSIDLADGLLGAGIRPAIVDFCIGGTQLEYWTAGATNSNYAAIASWCQARIAELTRPRPPIIVFYQGESGSAGYYPDVLDQCIAGFRSTFGAQTPLVLVQIPDTYVPAYDVGVIQAAYAEGDPLCRLACCHDSTYVTYPPPSGLHIDTASGRRLAIGPDNGSTVKSVLTCIRELLA